MRFVHRRQLITSLLLAAAAAAPLPLLADEPPYEVLDFEWADSSRARVVPVRLYLPRSASIDKLAPLVVFSHGIGGSRMGYSYLGSHWASQGVASLHLQHVGSDRNVWFGNPLALVGRLQGAAQDSEAVARVHDLRFALDRVFESPAAARLDAGRIVAAGHSYGANTTLLAAGARVERNGSAVDLREPRLRGAIIISAPPFYGERSPQAILSGVTLPTLHITATEDIIRIPGYYSGAEDRVAIFDAIGSAQKTLAVFSGGSHSMFTDRAGTGGSELNREVKSATKELSLAFLRGVFDGDHVALRAWPQRYGTIVARFVGAGS